MEGRRRVLHVVEIRVRLQQLVEGVRLRHVGHDGDGQLRARVGIADDLGLLLGPHRRHDFVASLQEELEDVGWSNVPGVSTDAPCLRIVLRERVELWVHVLAIKPDPPVGCQGKSVYIWSLVIFF